MRAPRAARILLVLLLLAVLTRAWLARSSAAAPAGADGVSATQVPAAALQDLRWRLLGPFRAGWATAVAGVPRAPHTFYFGAAGGGVWRTDDAGQTWQPLMQHETGAAIGALAIAPSDPHVLYAGTGQEGTRYDLMPGDGVYRSGDGGATWVHAGLAATRHIGAILVDPHRPNTVLVAAIGHAFGPNSERGVYRTADGGAHWRAVLQAGDSVGAVDLASDPGAPRVVYAALWQHRMHPWLDYFMPQAGPGSGIYRSGDGGEHWSRLQGGLPTGVIGRIGLAVARGSRGRIVYAAIDAPSDRPAANGRPAGGERAGLWASHDGGAHWTRVNPDASIGSSYFGHVTVAPDDSNTVYVMGRSIRRSRDGGAHFEVMRGSPGGDDYHALWVDPGNPRAMIAGSDQGAAVSLNGGATWSSWYNQPTAQLYHVAADDEFPYHVYSGQQDNGTVEIASRGPYGVIEERDWHPVGGDERDYMVPKPGEPRLVFGSGLGGGVSRFDEVTRQSADVAPWPITSYGARPTTVRYRYGWITPLVFAPTAPHDLYVGSQLLFRSRDDGDHWEAISPDLTGRRDGAGPCANPGLADARDCGYGVIASIAPSPLDGARIWVGTDSGMIQLTTDGGAHWRNVTPPVIPAWGVVFAIDPSPLDRAAAYAAVDLHRIDRHAPLLLRTRDEGRTWTPITSGIPADEFTSVVRCDPERKGLLYAGTNRAIYVSFDDGDSWRSLSLNLPTTWMRDLLVHDNDLIVGTQGRAIWVLDDLSPLRELAAGAHRDAVHLFAPAPAIRMRGSENHDTPWPPETALGENPPAGACLDYWLREGGGPVTLTIADAAGTTVRRFTSDALPESLPGDRYFEKEWTRPPRALSAAAGFHRFLWDLRYERPPAPGYSYTIAAVRSAGTPLEPEGPFVLPGRYTATLEARGMHESRTFEVRLDPRVRVTPAALREQLALARDADAMLARAVPVSREIARLRAKPDALPPGVADSLARIGGDDAGLGSVSRTIARLATSLEAADAAPTQSMRAALAECRARVDGLLARWERVRPAAGAPAGGH